MSDYDIDDPKVRLADLVDRAAKGEIVTLTRGGKTVGTVNSPAVAPTGPGRKMTAADIAWLRSVRVGAIVPSEDAGSFVSRMRDEEIR